MKKLLLVDGNSIINRAFYGTGAAMLSNSEGVYTGAVFGFLNILSKVLEEEKPSHILVAFDLKSPTFRHKMYAEYKAGRRPMPPELSQQFPILKDVLDAMNVKRLELEGFEADDILGTLSMWAKNNDMQAVLLTGDKDSLQLVDDCVSVLLPITTKGQTVTEKMDPEGVKNKMGVLPEFIIDLKSLMGDKSDNIPGCPGVGEKGACELINEFGCLENIIANSDSIKKNALRQKIKDNVDICRLSYTLATIDRHVPIENLSEIKSLEDLEEKPWNRLEVLKIFRNLEFYKLIKKYKLEEAATEEQPASDEENEEELSLFNFNFDDKYKNPKDIKINKDAECLYFEVIKNKNHAESVRYYDGTEDNTGRIDLREKNNIEDFLEAFREALEDEKIGKCFFEAKPFLLTMLENGCEVQGEIYDLAVSAYLADSTRKFEQLNSVCRFFTGEESKGVSSMPKIKGAAEKKLSEMGMTELCGWEMRLIPVLASMEFEGFTISTELLMSEGQKYGENLENLKKQIYDLCGEEFNINSPKQLGEVLFEHLGLDGGKKSKTGYKTGQEVLEKLAFDHPVIPLILEYRQNAKLKSTYIDGFMEVIDKNTGKVHSTFNQTVTATGRLSSSEPNLQNIPVRHELGRVIRQAFIASSENNVLVDADYSQIELRLLAWMSGDENMRNAFITGTDIHTLTAAQVNHVDIKDVTKEMRGQAKAVNFGIVYGISEFGLARDLGISNIEARRYIKNYFYRFPGIDTFLTGLVNSAKEKGYAETPFGRRRNLPELTNSKYMVRQFGERVAKNMPIQGAAADIMKIAMVKVYEALKAGGYKAKLILQVHDELLIDCPKEEEEAVKKLLAECMSNAVKIDVPLDVSVTSGYYWSK